MARAFKKVAVFTKVVRDDPEPPTQRLIPSRP